MPCNHLSINPPLQPAAHAPPPPPIIIHLQASVHSLTHSQLLHPTTDPSIPASTHEAIHPPPHLCTIALPRTHSGSHPLRLRGSVLGFNGLGCSAQALYCLIAAMVQLPCARGPARRSASLRVESSSMEGEMIFMGGGLRVGLTAAAGMFLCRRVASCFHCVAILRSSRPYALNATP